MLRRNSRSDILWFASRWSSQAFCRATSILYVNTDHHHFLPRIPILYAFTFWPIWSVPPMYLLFCETVSGHLTDITFLSVREYRWTFLTGFTPCTFDAIVIALLSVHLTSKILSSLFLIKSMDPLSFFLLVFTEGKGQIVS